MLIREARKMRQQRWVEGTITIALLFVALLCAASVASLQTIYLGAGVRGISVLMYEDGSPTGFLFWEGEPLMVGASLSIPQNSEVRSLPLVWGSRRWHAFLRFELERRQEEVGGRQPTGRVWSPISQPVKFRVVRELLTRKNPEGGWITTPQSPDTLNPLAGHESVRVEVQLLPEGGDLREGFYRGRAILEGQETPIGQRLVSPWFFFEVRAVRSGRDRLASLAHLGYRRLFAGDLEGAEKAFREMLSLHPDSIVGHTGLGDVYLERGNYKKAKEMFEKAIELLAGKRDSFVNPAVYERSDRFVRLKRRIERCEEMMRKG
jgi:hypothetical protein